MDENQQKRRKRTRRWVMLGVVVALLAVGYLYGLRGSDAPQDCEWKLDLAAVRAQANALPGSKPTDVRIEELARLSFPKAAVVAGAPWAMTFMAVASYQIVFPDHFLLLDTGFPESAGNAMHASSYNSAAWTRVEQAMRKAAAIYVTHEHADHLGGLAASLDNPQTLQAARITRAQLEHLDRLKPLVITPEVQAHLTAFNPSAIEAVAPGVVLIRASGHTPGSQLVYVQRQDGTEVLFLGDVAWHVDNLDRERGPPRLLAWAMKSQPHAVLCQLKELHALQQREPHLHEVPGHDGPRMEQLVSQGVLHGGFL
jgi:glyoxylase-like metal-dependent hydrolase (beta-lactamase superfamily II)